MPPNSDDTTGVLFESDAETVDMGLVKDLSKLRNHDGRKMPLMWHNIILFVFAHTFAVYGLWLLFVESRWLTLVSLPAVVVLATIGVSGGTHRLFAHRTFKVNTPLKVIFVFLHTLAYQHPIYRWARDHRVHHKYTETDADPYNSERGWWFAHIGWLCQQKHPEVIAKGKLIDTSDLDNDPLVTFQKEHYNLLALLIAVVLPTVLPMWLWGESLKTSFFVIVMLRWVLSLHITFLLNSSGHMFGKRPYDRNIKATSEAINIFLRVGDGYHNYHHAFPWDYKNAEEGYFANDFTNKFIEFFARIGWAYDLKSVPLDLVRRRTQRTGDGSHPIWGWGDKDQSRQDIADTKIINRRNVN